MLTEILTYKALENEVANHDEHDGAEYIRIPYSMSVLFLYSIAPIIREHLPDMYKQELDVLLDWIAKGDPEERYEKKHDAIETQMGRLRDLIRDGSMDKREVYDDVISQLKEIRDM